MIAYTNYSTDSRVIREAEALSGQEMKVDFISLKENEIKHRNVNRI